MRTRRGTAVGFAGWRSLYHPFVILVPNLAQQRQGWRNRPSHGCQCQFSIEIRLRLIVNRSFFIGQNPIQNSERRPARQTEVDGIGRVVELRLIVRIPDTIGISRADSCSASESVYKVRACIECSNGCAIVCGVVIGCKKLIQGKLRSFIDFGTPSLQLQLLPALLLLRHRLTSGQDQAQDHNNGIGDVVCSLHR